MKKTSIKSLISYFLVFILSVTLVGCNSNSSKKQVKKIKLNEVARSIFYAPMYVAINEGFFENEGLKIELSTGQGADTPYSKKQIKIATVLVAILPLNYPTGPS